MMQQNVSLFRRRVLTAALVAVWVTGLVPVLAQEVPTPKAGEQKTEDQKTSVPTPPAGPVEAAKTSTVERELTLPNGNLAYTATAEMMPIIDGKGETTAR